MQSILVVGPDRDREIAEVLHRRLGGWYLITYCDEDTCLDTFEGIRKHPAAVVFCSGACGGFDDEIPRRMREEKNYQGRILARVPADLAQRMNTPWPVNEVIRTDLSSEDLTAKVMEYARNNGNNLTKE